MNKFLVYIAEVSIVFSLLTVIYYLFLRRLTFYSLNRFILLSIIPVSLIIPQLKLNFGFSESIMVSPFSEYGSASPGAEVIAEGKVSSGIIDMNEITLWIYFSGMVIFSFIFIFNITRVFLLAKRSSSRDYNGYKVIQTDIPHVFSCFKMIFLPKNYDLASHGSILEHEKAHIRMYHTVDLIITELFIILSWFNPFAILFRSQLRSVHEYQADQQVIASGVRKSDYLQLMLSSITMTSSQSITSSFNSLTIKERIEMITKNKSKRTEQLKYLVLVPALVFMISAFAHFIGSEPRVMPIQKGYEYKLTAKFNKHVVIPEKGIDKVHGGIDFAAKEGTPVVASGAGKVIHAKIKGNWGNLVIIDHGDGLISRYAHLQGFDVKIGEEVSEGDVIGKVGNTGKSTGPHLHFEIERNGKKLDPEDFIKL
ncbi:peptidoglycan DD-metalloendopeptidase family protein [Mangrovivirga cuniculi]|uniref:Uncharacterized protein n=1 Tax=Mangrovivirga cuniculi TaxID=2715131 RepID=A0A4D7K520_9BACT|nr:peptidoglycan DD-metalloendopeptidase family protein [Mangrovivirga cuniculi]QCK14488.1 hypothetical protein DCC35_06905 [Mangrovivirga cuniculi]